MKKHFKFVVIFLLFFSCGLFAQTPLPIFSPNFSSAGGWQINGNAAVISSSYLRLTPNAGNQAGSAFWKQKVSLPDNFSFSTYFVSRMTPGSRADGMTFCIQQASNRAGSAGGGLGYQGIPGKSIAIEYDIYDNGEVGGNNHIALDINGVLHSGSTNVVASPVNLADGTNKHNWIEYNGVTNVLQVRISNTNVRPVNPTLSVTINLAANFIGVSDVFFGFTEVGTNRKTRNLFITGLQSRPFGCPSRLRHERTSRYPKQRKENKRKSSDVKRPHTWFEKNYQERKSNL